MISKVRKDKKLIKKAKVKILISKLRKVKLFEDKHKNYFFLKKK